MKKQSKEEFPKLTGKEFQYIIRKAGRTQKDFAHFIGKSHTWVTNHCAYTNDVPSYYLNRFREFVGPEVFDMRLKEYREVEERRKLNTQKPDGVIHTTNK
jgi:hypothetical protein